MEQLTREEVEELLREAVEKTEKSFGGTFKRMKAENEELQARLDAEQARFTDERAALESRIAEFDRELAEKRAKVGELAVREEIRRQLEGKAPLPERFVPLAEIPWNDDPEALSTAVAGALEKGRREFEETLREAGIPVGAETGAPSNPTNPAGRGTGTARDLKAASARDALKDMTMRGLIR